MIRRAKPYILVVLISLILLVFSACTQMPHERTQDAVDYTELKLDQGSAYIAISKNDESGYNRWIPFYFTISVDEDYSVESLERALTQNVNDLILNSNMLGIIYSTSDLIWSAYEVDAGFFNLSLVVIPGCGDLLLNEATEVNELRLMIHNEQFIYSLDQYVIEERSTISEDDFYITLATTETELNSELIAEIHFGICDKNAIGIDNFELMFPSYFAGIDYYDIIETRQEANNETQYFVNFHFTEQNNKVVLRPFISITYLDGTDEGWLIPSLPAYISCS